VANRHDTQHDHLVDARVRADADRDVPTHGDATSDRPAASDRLSTTVLVGLVAIVIAFLGIGGLHALQQPPFAPPDETAHVGYANEVASFRLPEIRRFPEVPIEAREWQAERSTASDIRYRSVWVANHPPLHYVAVAPLIWGSRVVEASDGGLILMRFANVAFAAVGVVFTFLLALEITRRNQRLALLAAALAALVPQGHAVFSQGLNDGLGFAAGTALVWAGARCIRRMDDLTRRDLVILAVAAVVGFGARAATMLLAVLVVGVVALARLVHPERPDPSVAERLRGAAGLVVLALGPAVLAFGWFYARNWVLYGDIGASQYLLEMFRREERGSVLEMFNRPVIWSNVFEGLLSPSTRQRLAPPGAAVLTLVAGVGVAFVLITGRLRVSAEPTDDQRVLRWQIGLCLATVAMIATTIAQHASGGGNTHARYAMPAIGVAAVLVVIGLERVWSKWAPLALVMVAGWWALLNLPVDVDPSLPRRVRDGGAPPPYPLRVLPLSDGWRVGAGVLIVIGVTVAAAALLAMLRSDSPGTPGDEPIEPDSPDPIGDGELVSTGSATRSHS
jgi:hypothetical protein